MPLKSKREPHATISVTPYDLSADEFEQIRVIVKGQTGISLGLHKRDLVISRLSKRLRALGLSSFREYIQYLEEAGDEDEVVQMVNRITTNKTDFFREKHHFEFLAGKVLPALHAAGEASGRRKLRIWSAGCSSGEEPYTIAMTVAAFFDKKPGWDIKILATDIDTGMLTTASRGQYDEALLEPVPRNLLGRYFSRMRDGAGFRYQVKPELRGMITFRKFNFMNETYPLRPDLDVVFCRNVLIYFDNDDKKRILEKIHKVIKPGGHLFVGHSESLMMVKHLFQYVGTTVYQKI
ncbi:MCP methyltransferase, CheR-type [Desulfarculus baarsii DSM 2075]|uniref:protein-glutamate O-methyltransferase n=1 Tax=Desulfarculus baarsii (strain ATCC 33931 / DSM 2075 / LMG 7858 / VKM B-1802 / 2st14) TaxID=644282 RepID=E1QFY7_DESB2|nr:protein-glutamate O-methyltransferase [Desulfarculus baarsii]ADK84597.1 MCP methyltransferase, CheR-type [Desulfarculus baarsii DSM 2075]